MIDLTRRGPALMLALIAFAVWVRVFADRMTIGPLLETMRVALDFTDAQIGALVGPASAVSGLTAIPIGLLIDRYSRLRLIVLLSVCCLTGTVLMAAASSFYVLFLGRMLIAISSAALIAAISLLADLYPPDRLGRATGFFMASENTAGPVAYIAGGALLGVLAVTPDAWRWTMLWLSVPALVLAAMVLLPLQEPARTGVLVKNPPLRTSFAELWRYRWVIVPLLAARVLFWIGDGTAVMWTAPLLQRTFGLSPEWVGTVMASGLLIAGITAPLLGGLLNDFCQRAGGPRLTMLALSALAVLMIPAGFFPFMPTALAASALMALFLTIGMTISAATTVISVIVVPNELRGTSYAVATGVGTIVALGGAPMLVGWLSSTAGGTDGLGRAVIWVCVSASVLGAAVFALGSRYVRSEALGVNQ